MSSKFDNISIRGRVAFAILCLENALKKNGHYVLWNDVLDALWSITAMEFVDEWLYKVSPLMPSSILEDQYEESNQLSYDQYIKLKAIYSKSSTIVFDILEFVFECGTIDLYGKIVDKSPRTIKVMNELISVMKVNEIPLPDSEIVSKFSFDENDGWGRSFTREELMN